MASAMDDKMFLKKLWLLQAALSDDLSSPCRMDNIHDGVA